MELKAYERDYWTRTTDLRQEVGREVLEVRRVHPFSVVAHDQEAPALAAKFDLYIHRARA